MSGGPGRALIVVGMWLAVVPITAAALMPRVATVQPGVLLEVTVVDFESGDGAAGIAVWNGAGGFPEEVEHAIDAVYVPISNGRAIASLGPFPPAVYAVTAYHDKNDNQRFDKNWIGMPREAWGMTRNPRPRLRAPRFDEAQVDFEAGTHRLEITLK